MRVLVGIELCGSGLGGFGGCLKMGLGGLQVFFAERRLLLGVDLVLFGEKCKRGLWGFVCSTYELDQA